MSMEELKESIEINVEASEYHHAWLCEENGWPVPDYEFKWFHDPNEPGRNVHVMYPYTL